MTCAQPTRSIPRPVAHAALDDGRHGPDDARDRRRHGCLPGGLQRTRVDPSPLGIAILALVVVRFANRLLSPPPPLPATVSRLERVAATASKYTMYGLLFILPLVGRGMLSAARYPVVLFGSVHLPFILPHDALLYATLQKAHTVLAYLLFLVFLAHFNAILFHTLIARDGMLLRMVPWNVRPREAVRGSDQPPARSTSSRLPNSAVPKD